MFTTFECKYKGNLNGKGSVRIKMLCQLRDLTERLFAELKDYTEDVLLEMKGLAVEILVDLMELVVEVLAFPLEN